MMPLIRLKPFFPGQWGIAESDMPLGIRSRPMGIVLYVDPASATANDDNDGTDPEHPLETITEALSKCTSGNGDVIRVMPGTYSENLVVNKDFVTIEGCVEGGYARPDIEGNRDVALTVHAQGFVMKHCRIAAAVGEIGVIQQGNGYLYDDCVFDGDGAQDFQLLPDLDDDSYSASEGCIQNSLFRGGTKGLEFKNPGPGVEGGIGPTDVIIQGNRFYGNSAADIDDVDTAGSNDKTFTDSLIAGNFFMTVGAAVVYIDLSAGTLNSGLIGGNVFADADVTNAQIVIPAGVIQAGNYDTAGFVVL